MSGHPYPTTSWHRWLRSAVLGPFASSRKRVRAAGLAGVVLLTLLTQVGGLLVWPALGLAAQWKGHRAASGLGGLALGVVFYVVGSLLLVPPLARITGRAPLPIRSEQGLAPRTPWFAILNRHYVQTPLRARMLELARASRHEDAELRYLDASFPFPSPLPMLPHLSHGNGRNVDLALPLIDAETGESVPGGGSPIGYWGYVTDPPESGKRPDPCHLRWDLGWLQPLWGPVVLDRARLAAVLREAARTPQVEKMLLEQRLIDALALDPLTRAKTRDQGACAARHDDHLHLRFR